MADYTRSVDDAAAATDVGGSAADHIRETDDTTTGVDIAGTSTGHVRAVDDTATATDAGDATLNRFRSTDDTATATGAEGTAVDYARSREEGPNAIVRGSTVAPQIYSITQNEIVHVYDTHDVWPPWMPRSIVIRNISAYSLVIDTQDNSTKGNLGISAYAATIRPTEAIPIPFWSYKTIAANIKARWATMWYKGLIQVFDTDNGELKGEEIVDVT